MNFNFGELTVAEKEILIKILKEKTNETMALYMRAKKGEKLEFTQDEYGDSLESLTQIMLKLGF